MFTLFDHHRHASGRLSRREWLQFGALAGLGSITGAKAADKNPAGVMPGFGKAKSVIVVFTSGGQSQIDLWDPKPNAPLDVRGDFQPISTSVTGIHFGEHLP